jgi:nucleolar MIF4G domain-containing protein 1
LDELLDDLDRLEGEALGMGSDSDGDGDSGDEEDEFGADGMDVEEDGMMDEEDEWGGIADADQLMEDDDEGSGGEGDSGDEESDGEDEVEAGGISSTSRKVAFAASPSSSPPPTLVPAVSQPSTLLTSTTEIATIPASVSSISAAAPTKYIPPALRARLAAEEGAASGDASKREELVRLEKTGKGLLNRMGESNVEGILGEVEGLYRKFARNGQSILRLPAFKRILDEADLAVDANDTDVTSTLTKLILETISSHSNLLDSFVVLYATLVAGLYKIVGIEFGSSLVSSLFLSPFNKS